jgi:hypothetical protein
VALKAIESGASPQDDEVFAEYQTAAMNRGAQANRQADDTQVNAALKGVSTEPETKDLGDLLMAQLDAEKSSIHA